MTTTGSTSSSTPVSGFVGVSGTHFVLNGCPFYFAGTNNYYLTYKSDFMISDVLDATVAMGYSVIRIWGFLDIGSLDGSVSSTDGYSFPYLYINFINQPIFLAKKKVFIFNIGTMDLNIMMVIMV